MVMKKIAPLAVPCLIFCLAALPAQKASAQAAPSAGRQNHIQLELDSGSARALLDLFTRGKADDEELARVVKLPATQAMIRQAARFDPSATEDNFKSTLRRVIETGSSAPDPFRFAVVKARLEPVRSLLTRIESSPQTFLDGVSG